MILNDPARLPGALGVKVMLIVQLAATARLLPQLFVWPKSPVTLMLLMVSAAVPLFVKVAACATLGVLTT